MLGHQRCAVLLLISLATCGALRCTTNCSFSYDNTHPFHFPDTCNHIVSAGKCSAMLSFMFESNQYWFNLFADPNTSIYVSNNQRRGKLQLISASRVYLSHFVDIACKDKDDCARDLAIRIAAELSQRRYDFSRLVYELAPLMQGPSNAQLNCFDGKQKEQRCATPSSSGTCLLTSQVDSNKMTSSCEPTAYLPEVSISMYQDSNTATFDIRCNRNLCNTQSTLRATKEILFRYNVTQTPDGRLSGCSLHASISLILAMSVALLCRQ